MAYYRTADYDHWSSVKFIRKKAQTIRNSLRLFIFFIY